MKQFELFERTETNLVKAICCISSSTTLYLQKLNVEIWINIQSLLFSRQTLDILLLSCLLIGGENHKPKHACRRCINLIILFNKSLDINLRLFCQIIWNVSNNFLNFSSSKNKLFFSVFSCTKVNAESFFFCERESFLRCYQHTANNLLRF